MTQPSESGWAPIISEAPAWSQATPEQRDAARAAAISVINALTGDVYGLESVLCAPCTPRPANTYGRRYALGVQGLDAYVGGYCTTASLMLPGPMHSVQEVRIDGVVLAPTEYRLDNGSHLVRITGGWPQQNLDDPTFLVRYTRGWDVPVTANVAAGMFATELLKGMVAPATCKLPSTTRDVARAGVSISLADPTELTQNGLTGIKVIDDLVASLNPGRKNIVSTVWTPELARHRILA